MKLGLTSVTFRNLSYSEVIEYCNDSGLSCIEWGSDVHLPENEPKLAEEIYAATVKSGLFVSSYGSYYKVGKYENYREIFLKYLNTANIIKSPIIRVWAGDRGSYIADEKYYQEIVAETKNICDMAAMSNINVAFEYHENSLSDCCESVRRLVTDINKKNFGTYFQYTPTQSIDDNIRSLESILPFVKMIHVFNINERENRLSINEGNGIYLWENIIKILKKNNVNINMLFEFLKEDTLEGLVCEKKIMDNLLYQK